MYLSRSLKGFGWYTKVVSKDLNTNAERTGYINFSFKKGCEPQESELNEKGAYVGDLYLHDANGNIRKVFPIVNDYTEKVEFKILEIENANSTIRKEQDNFGAKYTDIKSDDLPFY